MSVDSWVPKTETPFYTRVSRKFTESIPFLPTDPANPEILTLSPLPCATIGEEYTQALNGQGVGTLRFALTDGSLPPGLTLSPEGIISGTTEALLPQIRKRTATSEVITTYDISVCCPGPFPSSPAQDGLRMNLSIVRGDSLAFDLTVFLNGVSVDITGATFRMTAKWSVTDDDAGAVFIKTSSPADGIVITDAANGMLSITLEPVDTIGLPDHSVNLDFDVQMTDTTGAVYTILYGSLQVIVDVSVQAP